MVRTAYPTVWLSSPGVQTDLHDCWAAAPGEVAGVAWLLLCVPPPHSAQYAEYRYCALRPWTPGQRLTRRGGRLCTGLHHACLGLRRARTNRRPAPKSKAEANGVVQTDTTPTETEGGGRTPRKQAKV